MSSQSVVIVGTGGSGRETYWLLSDYIKIYPNPIKFEGFVGLESPDPIIFGRLQVPFLGSPMNLVERIPKAAKWHYCLGIGNHVHRRAMDDVLSQQGLKSMSIIHSSVQIGPDVEIGAGAVVCANSTITTNVRIGYSSQFNIGCVVGHDVRIGDYVTLAQSVSIAGNVIIEDDVTVYSGATILPGVNIGKGSRIGAGAVVIEDVAPNTTVVGIPAKPVD